MPVERDLFSDNSWTYYAGEDAISEAD
jgi:hypothetical protein